MDTENFVVNNGCEGEVIEDLCAVAPDINTSILTEALIVETIYLRDLTRFMVSTDQSDALWISDLQGEQEQEGFNGVVASIDEVAHE